MTSESKPPDRDDDGSQLSDPPLTESVSSGSDGEQRPTEWLATTRQRRSTAGNRMKAMLANEEPDSDLELLFAEDDDDDGFSDAGDDGSDVRMDSSSDDDDDDGTAARADDLEGERELERQARERRAAQRKRAARDAIPAKFRKKVRIGPATTPAAPAPRPKKKSERASWLPSPADLPTRASSRHTTRISKEQLHQQMAEREARRLRQLALMEHKAARLEAARKPPMTQHQRLAEAAVVERRNSKSLNRWEEAEKLRDEERRAKLAALNNRTLSGPVITFWSGVRQWKDALGQHVTMVEAKPKKKRDAAASVSVAPTPGADSIRAPDAAPATACSSAGNQAQQDAPARATTSEARAPPTVAKHTDAARLMAMPPLPGAPASAPSSGGLAAPAPLPQNPSPLTTPLPVSRPQDPRPSGVLAAPVLAPPPGLDIDGPRPMDSPKSNVLAPPSIQSALPERPAALAAATTEPCSRFAVCEARFQPIDEASKSASPGTSEAPPQAAAPARSSTTARNAIIYQSFDHHAIRDKSVQTQILFGRKMSRLSKPSPPPLCVITNQTARYRDPKTGLPYYNAFAYREIQRLHRGDYRWSRLLGAWVGTGTYAAHGVPHRFVHPEPEAERRRRLEETARQKQARSDAEQAATEPEPGAPQETETAAAGEAKAQKAAAAETQGAGGDVQPQQAAVTAQ